MAMRLNAIERRVFGALLEKALAQSQYYPMTLNALVAACNQKSNRDPVMEIDEEAVWNALEVMRAGGLVSRVMPGGASRVERYRHEALEQLGWEKPQRAVMAELLLRGPQTVGELRGRCTRMFPFENTESVTAVLDSLAQTDPPTVASLPRTPGRSAIRFAHRLYADDEWAQLAGDEAASPTPTVRTAETAHAARPAETSGADVRQLREELSGMQGELADLYEQLSALRRRIEHLEG
jgi:uncharacterized protein YceH (UPF0502 family)